MTDKPKNRFDWNDPKFKNAQIRFLDDPADAYLHTMSREAFAHLYLNDTLRHDCNDEDEPRCILCEREVVVPLLTEMARELFIENPFAPNGIDLRLHPDVKRWCIDSLEGNMAKPFRKYSDENGNRIATYGVRFLTLNDAIHFKLRWVGY